MALMSHSVSSSAKNSALPLKSVIEMTSMPLVEVCHSLHLSCQEDILSQECVALGACPTIRRALRNFASH
eukprot:4753582-Karenia_brevis.AAC.1